MALEKKRYLRKIEFTFEEGQLLPDCHCEYVVSIDEDGSEVARRKEREVVSSRQTLSRMSGMPDYVFPDQ